MDEARHGGKTIRRERQETEAASNIHICPCLSLISRNVPETGVPLQKMHIEKSIKRHEKSPA